jgi:hypothetical protein
LLNQFNVRSCRQRATQQQLSPDRTKKPSTNNPSTTRKMPPTPATRALTALRTPPSRGRQLDYERIERDFGDLDIGADVTADMDPVIIDVDVNHPGRNREVIVYSLLGVLHDDSVYNCFEIYLSIDPRDFLRDSIEAKLISDKEILITMPALPYSFYKDTDERNKRLKTWKTHDKDSQMAQDIAINNMDMGKDGANPTKYLLLRFPDHVFLSNVFEGGRSKNLQTHLQMDKVAIEDEDTENLTSPCFVKWKVADEGAARRLKLKAAPKSSKTILAEQLKSMSTKSSRNTAMDEL